MSVVCIIVVAFSSGADQPRNVYPAGVAARSVTGR